MGLLAGRTELIDSTPLLQDGDALRARIRHDGYVFVRGVLDRELVGALGRRGLDALQEAGWTESGNDPVTASPRLPVRAVVMRDAFSDPALRRIVLDPALHALAFSPTLSGLIRRIMGPSAFCYPLKIPRVVYPSSLMPAHPGNLVHKDFRVTQDVFTCWVPLSDVPTTLGGLAVLPGSQSSSRVAPRPLERLEPGWLTTDYEAGDVVVLHCMTTHASLPNLERRLRFSAEYRWQLADQPAPRRMVLGPLGTELGARVFRHAPWWRPVPPDLTLVDDEAEIQGGRPTVPASRFVAVTPDHRGRPPRSAPPQLRATEMQSLYTADDTGAAHAVTHEALESGRQRFGRGGIRRVAARAQALARGRLDLP
jgi:Phytanoyl-CoA dioxygenase (PhyH)